MNNKIKIHLDTKKFTGKPTKSEASIISQRIAANEPISLTRKELIDQVGNQGMTFTPATFINKKRNNDNWVSQQVFCLDFDQGTPIEEIKKQLKKFGLDCNCIYKTFSYKVQHPKYRVLFFTEEPIIDRKERDAIQFALMTLFKGFCDEKCNDKARFFYGGKGVVVENLDYNLEIELLKRAASSLGFTQTNDTNKSRKATKLKKQLELIERKEHSPIRDVNFKDLLSKTKIGKYFINSSSYKDRLHYAEVFGIASNLYFFEGGLKFFKECLDEDKRYQDYHYAIADSLRYYDYHPMNIKNFSPYLEDQDIGKNFVEIAKFPKGLVRRIEKPKESMSLEESRQRLERITKRLSTMKEDGLTYVSGAAGLGKTKFIQEYFKFAVIALPNNKLKEEFAIFYPHDYVSTPEYPKEKVDCETNKQYELLTRSGCYQEAFQLLKEQAHKTNNLDLLIYIEQLKKALSTTDKTVITTHVSALTHEFELDTVIFDECILNSILSINTIKVGELYNLINQPNLDKFNKDSFEIFLSQINQLSFHKPKYLRDFLDFTQINRENLRDVISNLKEPITVLKFLDSSFFTKNNDEISFITIRKPITNKKTIVFTANPNSFIYKHLFKEEKINIIDLPPTKIKGSLFQYTFYSCSRSNLEMNQLFISAFIKQKYPAYKIITYKKSQF